MKDRLEKSIFLMFPLLLLLMLGFSLAVVSPQPSSRADTYLGIQVQNQVAELTLIWEYNASPYSAGYPQVESVAISDDGSYVIAGSYDANVYFFDRSGFLWNFTTLRAYRQAVAISENGSYAVCGSMDNHVYLFDKDGNLIWDFASSKNILCADISADGRYIVAGGEDTMLYFFSKESSTALWSSPLGGYVWRCKVSGDGSYVVAGTEALIDVYDRDGSELWWCDTDSSVKALAISHDGEYIAAGLANGTILFFSVDSNSPLWTYTVGGAVCEEAIAMSDDGSYIIVGSRDGKAYLFDKDGNLLWTHEAGGWVYEVAMSSDGSYIALGTVFASPDRVVVLGKYSNVTLATFETAKPGEDYSGLVLSLDMSADGRYIVAGTYTGWIYLLESSLGATTTTTTVTTVSTVTVTSTTTETVSVTETETETETTTTTTTVEALGTAFYGSVAVIIVLAIAVLYLLARRS